MRSCAPKASRSRASRTKTRGRDSRRSLLRPAEPGGVSKAGGAAGCKRWPRRSAPVTLPSRPASSLRRADCADCSRCAESSRYACASPRTRTMNERTALHDDAERAAALDAARSFIVQAPAGSGKTELLIQRYLALLARVERPEAIGAMPFPRRAGGEIRNRIVTALREREPPPQHERNR